jgi:hypothetical protein
VIPASTTHDLLRAGQKGQPSVGRTGHPSFLVGLFVLASILLGSISFGDGLYLSQFFLVAFLAAILVSRGKGRMLAPLAWSALSIVVLYGLAYSVGGTNWDRFQPEFFKTALLVLSAIILWGELSWGDLKATSVLMPPAVLAVAIYVLVTGQGDYYGEEGRFGVPWWGSPNTTAFVICVGIALWLYDMQTRVTAMRNSADRGLVLGLQGVVLLGMIGFVIYTASSGGLLTLGVILARYVGIRLRAIFLTVPFIIAAVWLAGIEIPELIGSGRPLIWETLLQNQYSAGVGHWLLGFGPGSIDLHPWFTAHVVSAHSMYIEVLYNWGFFALCGMVVALVRFGNLVKQAPLELPRRLFVEALFAGLVAGFFVDTYLLTAQMTWLGGFIFGFGGTALRKP